MDEQIAMAFNLACESRIEMYCMSIECKRREAEQESGVWRESM